MIALLLHSAACYSARAEQGEPASNQVTRLPEVSVTGEALKENLPVGPNQQPEWTAHRRFPFTRVYVLPPLQLEAESGWDATWNRSGNGPPLHMLTQEFELGLPNRFQVDYEFAGTINDPAHPGRERYASSSFELRWALADWGKIPMNPTLKAEYKLANAAADSYELSLSLGDQFAERWHWAVDFFYEQQVGDDRETEHTMSGALSYTVIDEKFGIGIESQLKDETDDLDRNSHLVCLVGPSMQWRPTPNTHLDLVPLFGATGPSPRVESFVFFGIDFGAGKERGEAIEPASLRNR